MRILTVDHVTKTYPATGSAGESIRALDDVSIHVGEREFLTILGPSGCGKTTLLRLAAGFERPTRGKVLFEGKEVTRPGSDRVVVFQRPWLYPWLNVRDNIAFGLKLQRRKIDWGRVDEAIRTVGLEGFAKRPPYQLSGGMQQRTALARALVMSPKVLLMDEPFGALDAQTRQLMQEFLLRLWDSISATVVFITHDIEEAILLGDRMVVMSAHPGRVALEMPISLPRPRNEETTLDPRFVEIRRKALETLRGSVLASSGITDGARPLDEQPPRAGGPARAPRPPGGGPPAGAGRARARQARARRNRMDPAEKTSARRRPGGRVNGRLPRLIEVARDAGEPLYRQLRRAIEHGIVAGKFDFDTPLPSSRELARELGLSRNTVNTAYQELAAEGFIVARPRSGVYVNEEMRLHAPAAAPGEAGITAGVRWTERLRQLPDSSLPEIEKIPDWQHYPYPFIAGQVASAVFPTLAWAAALREALRSPHLHYSLRDGISADDPLLVDMLCRHILPGRGIGAGPDEILITMGSQQGLHLISEALLGPGSVVGIEDPGYLDARHIFVRSGARILPVPVDRSGLIPPANLRGIDLIYTTPSHHHPTNVTLGIGRRRQLLMLAEQDDSLIVEDDYDSELRYQGSPSPALKALDRTGRVVYIGTFSKFLAPGLRLGYLVGHRELIAHLRSERRYSIRHPPGHVQRAMALLIDHGHYYRAVRRHRASLQRKWEAMTEAVNRNFPWQTTPPPGGSSIWMTGPDSLNSADLVAHAQRRGVILERGDIFFVAGPDGHRHFRLGFAAIDPAAIEPGIKILAGVVNTQLSRARG